MPEDYCSNAKRFQPTPSARRVTTEIHQMHTDINISTHTLRKEGDYNFQIANTASVYFNPHPPQGG